ncbi:MAG: hypothetical protein QOK42_1379 [Frankiaceae bacterium]|jgi:hypothetical protein|nr:hypothetical protein [Frankiaceae bacterium]
MTPEELERQLAAATSGIDAPSSAWSTIASRGRVRRHRRAAVLGATAVALPVAVALVLTQGPDRGGHGALGTGTPPTGHTASQSGVPSASPTASPSIESPYAVGPTAPMPKRMVAVSGGEVWLYEQTNRVFRRTLRLSLTSAEDVSLSPAKETAVYTTVTHCHTDVWSVRLDGTQRHVIYSADAHLTAPRLSPDGTALAFGTDPCTRSSTGEAQGRLAVVDLYSGHTIWLSSGDDTGVIQQLSWSGNERASWVLTSGVRVCCGDYSAFVFQTHPFGSDKTERRIDDKAPYGCDVQAEVIEGRHSAQVNGCSDGFRVGPVDPRPGVGFLSDASLLPEALALDQSGAHALVLMGDGKTSELYDVPLNGSRVRLLISGVTSADW